MKSVRFNDLSRASQIFAESFVEEEPEIKGRKSLNESIKNKPLKEDLLSKKTLQDFLNNNLKKGVKVANIISYPSKGYKVFTIHLSPEEYDNDGYGYDFTFGRKVSVEEFLNYTIDTLNGYIQDASKSSYNEDLSDERYNVYVSKLSDEIRNLSRFYRNEGISLEDVLRALDFIAVHYENLADIDDLLESFKGRKNQINQLKANPLTEAVLDGLKEYEQKGWDWWGIPGVKVKSHRGYPSLEYKGFLFNISDTEDALKDSFMEETGLDPDEEKNEKKFDSWVARHGEAWFDAAASEEEEALDDFDDDKLESFRNKKVSNNLIIESICDLLEASMSDEDKRDSEIIRNLYKRVGGKKVSKFTPEEQEVIDKYGLDVWGFRGDTAMITPGKNDVVKNGDLNKISWDGRRSIPNKNADKINFADRARKTDSRDWGRQFAKNDYFATKYPNEKEREAQAREMKRPYDELKAAKFRYNLSKKKVDDYYSDLAKQIEKANDEYIQDTNNAIFTKQGEVKSSSTGIKNAQTAIDDLLNKHRKAVKEALRKLSLKEAMSDEDRKDSQILKDILSKIDKRSNARLTPEENAVLDKYNIKRLSRGLRGPNTSIGLDYYQDAKNLKNPEYNLAGKFRTGDREYANTVKRYGGWGDTFQTAERDRESDMMGKDVSSMKNALDSRKYWTDRKNKAEQEYDDAMDAAKANREKKIAQLMDLERYKVWKDWEEKDKAGLNDVRRKYGLKTEESLKEDFVPKYFYRVMRYLYNNDYDGCDEIELEELLMNSPQFHNMSEKTAEAYVDEYLTYYRDPREFSKLRVDESLQEDWGDGFDRKIDFYGDKVESILGGIQGQMSDGIWENTPSMEAYWQNFKPKGDAIFVPTRGYDWASRLRNPYAEMSDSAIRRYFANKAKYIAQLWMHDNRINPYKNWNADNTEECDYMHDGITVADMFEFFNKNK